jgi:hypothetical protein
LPFGTIQFLGPDGIPCAGSIQPDGTFSVRVPVGEAKVIVSCVDESRMNHLTRPSSSQARAVAPSRSLTHLSLIPQRYADWDTSGLAVRVEGGRNTQDFALRAK